MTISEMNGDAVVQSILGWAAIGLIVGLIAMRILPGREPGSRVVTILACVAGALIAGFVDRELGRFREGGGAGWIAAMLGAVVLLTVYRLFMRGRENS
jgi:uncharacterized membrane protein YeaQ/YmgE (transglycosylase-associated protein family)